LTWNYTSGVDHGLLYQRVPVSRVAARVLIWTARVRIVYRPVMVQGEIVGDRQRLQWLRDRFKRFFGDYAEFLPAVVLQQSYDRFRDLHTNKPSVSLRRENRPRRTFHRPCVGRYLRVGMVRSSERRDFRRFVIGPFLKHDNRDVTIGLDGRTRSPKQTVDACRVTRVPIAGRNNKTRAHASRDVTGPDDDRTRLTNVFVSDAEDVGKRSSSISRTRASCPPGHSNVPRWSPPRFYARYNIRVRIIIIAWRSGALRRPNESNKTRVRRRAVKTCGQRGALVARRSSVSRFSLSRSFGR